MACYPCEVWRVLSATTDQRTVATMGFITDECVIPSTVNAGEPFDIQIKYKLCTIETRNPNGNLAHFPGYDGIYYRYRNLIHTNIEYWVWRLQQVGLSFMANPPTTLDKTTLQSSEVEIDMHGRGAIQPGDEFIYTWHGTIEELLGLQFTSPTTVNLAWSIYDLAYVAYEPSDWLPWNWAPSQSFLDFSRSCWIKHSIQVNILPAFPYPLFNGDLCSLSKTTVAPGESFDIKVTIENQNGTSGSYSIGCYCGGNYTELAAGTIGGLKAMSFTFHVTANQLAHQAITESQYLAFTIAVSNNEKETDRWTPAAIAVLVTSPPPSGTANLSGLVTDKQTGAGMAGVSITAAGGYSTSTNSSGSYTLAGLEPGSYSIKFSKAGYWDETKSKILVSGQNTLDIAITPTTEPQPSKISWGLIGAGALGMVGLVLAVSKVKREKKK